MALIQDIATTIDGEMLSYVTLVFEATADPIRTLLKGIGLVTLLFVAVNHVTQFRQISYTDYLGWGIRYVLIYAFATMWANFGLVYYAVRSITEEYPGVLVAAVARTIESGNIVFDPAIAGRNTYSGLDELGHAIVHIAKDFLADTSITDVGGSIKNVFTGALILIIGGIFTAAAAVIVMIGKVGLILAVSMAPLGILMLMSEHTKQYFQGWVSFVIGFAVIPLLLGCLTAIVLFVAGRILSTSGANAVGDNKQLYFGFIFVLIAALVLLFHLPTMAQTVAQASATVGGGNIGRRMTSAAGRMTGASALKNYMQALPARAMGATLDPRKAAHGIGAAVGAFASGAGKRESLKTGFAAFRRHSQDRKMFWTNRREGKAKGPAQMSPNPAYQSSRPSAAPSSSGSGGGQSSQMSPEQQNQYRR